MPKYTQGFRVYFHNQLTESTIHLIKNDIFTLPDNVDEIRGELKTRGPWQLPISYKALAIDKNDKIYGIRTMTNVVQSGYELEGKVTIGGQKYRAFTSSQLFERPDGSLVDIATIHVCI